MDGDAWHDARAGENDQVPIFTEELSPWPCNPAREAQDPFTISPPATDKGTLPNLKWSCPGWVGQLQLRFNPFKAVMLAHQLYMLTGQTALSDLQNDRYPDLRLESFAPFAARMLPRQVAA